jgi:hypothetical protein
MEMYSKALERVGELKIVFSMQVNFKAADRIVVELTMLMRSSVLRRSLCSGAEGRLRIHVILENY